MMQSFVTGGNAYPCFNENGDVIYHKVERKDSAPIILSRTLPEYFESGHFVHIDSHGRPWVLR